MLKKISNTLRKIADYILNDWMTRTAICMVVAFLVIKHWGGNFAGFYAGIAVFLLGLAISYAFAVKFYSLDWYKLSQQRTSLIALYCFLSLLLTSVLFVSLFRNVMCLGLEYIVFVTFVYAFVCLLAGVLYWCMMEKIIHYGLVCDATRMSLKHVFNSQENKKKQKNKK